MQAVKPAVNLLIMGSYYDSQLYSGLLYLWTRHGSVMTIDWEGLMDDYIKNSISDELKLAVYCAFQRSNCLYEKTCALIFRDKQIKSLLKGRFDDLSACSLFIEEATLQKYLVKEQDNPFPFPHSDSLLYSNQIYVAGPDGIFHAGRGGAQHPVSTNIEKLFDCPILGVSASYHTLALSAGSEGLFQYNLRPILGNARRGISDRPIIHHHSNWSGWMYHSIFSASYKDVGRFAYFSHREDKTTKTSTRTLEQVISANELLPASTLGSAPVMSWGIGDKICLLLADGRIEVVQYKEESAKKTREDSNQSLFRRVGSIYEPNHNIKGLVQARSAVFGYIVETEDELLVLASSDETDDSSEYTYISFPGEPVNWRVFPDSIYYTNQLHIIYENHLSIHSFNHDYFVDQVEKVAGISSYSK